MVDTEAPSQSEPRAGMSLAARFIGILVWPRETYERVAAAPRWFGILAVSLAMVAAIGTTFLTTEVGQRALLAQQIEGMERFGMTITDEVYERMEGSATYAPYFVLANLFVGVPIITVVVAGVLYIAAYGFLGAKATFAQVFAVVAHGGVVFVVQQAFVAPLNYVRGSMSNPATLGAFVPMLDTDTFVVRFLSAIDVFFVWWVMVLSIGLAVVCGRRTAPIATTLLMVYASVAVVIAVVLTRMAG